MPSPPTDDAPLKQGDLAVVVGLSSKEGFAYNYRIAKVVKPPETADPDDRVGIALAFMNTRSALPHIKVRNSALRPICGGEDRVLEFLDAVADADDVKSYRRLVNKPVNKQAVSAHPARLLLVVQDSSTGEMCPNYPVRYAAPPDGKICMTWLEGWDACIKRFLALLHARPDCNGSLTLHFPDEILIVQLRAHSDLITTVAWQEHFGEQFSKFCMAVDSAMFSDASDEKRGDETDAHATRRLAPGLTDHEASAENALMPPPSPHAERVRSRRPVAQVGGANAESKAGASGASGASGAASVGANSATVATVATVATKPVAAQPLHSNGAAQLTNQDRRDLQAQAKVQAETRGAPKTTPYGADLTTYTTYKNNYEDLDCGYMQPSAKWREEDRNTVRAKGHGFDHLPPYPVHSDGRPAIPMGGGPADSSSRSVRTEAMQGAAHGADDVEEARMLVQAMFQGFSRQQAMQRVVEHKKLQRGAASTDALGQIKRVREQSA